MTRGPIPRFDLYEELEVSRLASAEVIEAAYRTLVKRHHPDVSADSSIDADRIKRLNVAHGWLTNAAKRRRYDEATDRPAAAIDVPTAAPGSKRRVNRDSDAGPTPMQEPVPMGFGPYSAEVRQFLADLRPIDERRAEKIRAGRAEAPSTAYAEARGAALAASRGSRHDQWLLARDAATVIAKGKLGDWPHAAEIAAVVADIAGAYVVRDRIQPDDFELLLSPWTYRSQPEATAVAAGTGRSPAIDAVLQNVRDAVPVARRPASIGVAAALLVSIVALAVVAGGPPKPEVAVAGLTDAPTASDPGPVGVASPGAPTPDGSISGPGGAAPTSAAPPTTPGPLDSPAPPTIAPAPGSTPSATARPTPRPTTPPTAVPTPAPTATLIPTAEPTPEPTASPRVICTVISLIGVNTSNAQVTWATAGFAGTVMFSPGIPPQYKIGWQSLTPGDEVPCTSDVTVQELAP